IGPTFDRTLMAVLSRAEGWPGVGDDDFLLVEPGQPGGVGLRRVRDRQRSVGGEQALGKEPLEHPPSLLGVRLWHDQGGKIMQDADLKGKELFNRTQAAEDPDAVRRRSLKRSTTAMPDETAPGTQVLIRRPVQVVRQDQLGSVGKE